MGNPVTSWLILIACILVGLLNEVSASILNLSLPDAARDVGASPPIAQFILLVGKLTLGALLLAGGGLGDRFGQKRTLLVGTALVAIAAVLSIYARSAGMLGGARILDGIGNALVSPLALAICISVFPEQMRARIIGIFLGVSGLGIAIGPLIAGVLIQIGGWRVGFFAPLGLAVVSGVAIAVLVPRDAMRAERLSLDTVGMVLCVIGLTALVLGFVQAGREGWLSATTLVPGLGGLACLAGFAWWEITRARNPLLEPALLRSRNVIAALAAALLAAMVLNGTVIPLLYFFQRIHGDSPVMAVLRLLPLIVTAMAVAPVAGGLAERYGRRLVMTCGLVSIAVGSGVMAALTPQTGYGQMLVALVLIGGGVMAVLTPAADLVMATATGERSGAAAALNSAILQVGGAIGIGVITSLFLSQGLHSFFERMTALGYSREQIQEPARRLREIVRETALHQVPQLPDIPPQLQRDILDAYSQAFATGVARSFMLAAVLAVLAIFIVLFGMRRQVATVRQPS
ncbi:MAG: MFS transporter [Rhodospirillaceae bacterium]|nr:MFS transporter [Rhodospirillales bacterium]